jgi:hypothetical protein
MDQNEYIRTRSICLKRTDDGQANRACTLLKSIKGVYHATPINKHRLKLTYSLELLSFELIEGLLKELGFSLDLSMPAYLRRYYYQYMEDSVRETLEINDEEHKLVCSLDESDPDESEQYWDQYH